MKIETGKSRCSGRRSGAVLALTLVTIVVAMAMLMGVLKSAVSHQRQFRTDQYRIQADWLVQAGVDRAITKLRQSSAYAGEKWTIDKDALDGFTRGEVEIQVRTSSDRPGEAKLIVQAVYPDDPIHRAQLTREVTVYLN